MKDSEDRVNVTTNAVDIQVRKSTVSSIYCKCKIIKLCPL